MPSVLTVASYGRSEKSGTLTPDAAREKRLVTTASAERLAFGRKKRIETVWKQTYVQA